MLVAADDAAMTALATGGPVDGLTTAPDLESPEVLAMLADLARQVRPAFDPAAWLIVDGDTIVGLVSLVAPPVGPDIKIGYGIAPSRRGAGLARAAVADLIATVGGRVGTITAETATDNLASQRVLTGNGFTSTGTRIDAEDGELLGWRLNVGGVTPATDRDLLAAAPAVA